MKVLIYNEDTNKMESYNRSLGSPMPYIKNRYLTLKEFKGSTKSQILWSTKRTMEAFNKTRERWRKPIYVGYAFKRIFEGGHSGQSQHYVGVSFDTAQNLSVKQRTELYNLAKKLKVWVYVEPLRLTPRWLHFDKRATPSACSAGYPALKMNSKGNYVLVLQDALNTLNYNTGGLDGIYGQQTNRAVQAFQSRYNISENGVQCKTWQKLSSLVVGKGKSNKNEYY